MASEKAQPKMYLEIVRELRQLIEEENIKTGGKLPSERVLAERMEVGRSTVREALRSLELLGIIETRRGEGTFLADFQRNQFVEVLSGFILQQSSSIDEITDIKRMIEEASIEKICLEQDLQHSPIWQGFLMKVESGEPLYRHEILREMIVNAGNRLALKMWMLISQYAKVETTMIVTDEENENVLNFLRALQSGDCEQALCMYKEWMKQIEVLRGEI